MYRWRRHRRPSTSTTTSTYHPLSTCLLARVGSIPVESNFFAFPSFFISSCESQEADATSYLDRSKEHVQGLLPVRFAAPLCTSVYLCVPLCTPVYPGVPLCTPVYPCVPMCTHVYPCVPMCTVQYCTVLYCTILYCVSLRSPVYPCVPLCTPVYCTPVYRCVSLCTPVYPCVQY
jgi:hypothetical protein